MNARPGTAAGAHRIETGEELRRKQSPSRKRSTFRPDIEGLRAVAILAVVLYHAHLSLIGGGYAGVDVFFVVSGYLITGLLWRELQRDRRVSLRAFYGRRARRLLPASILVVVVTAIAARQLLPPLQVPSVAKDGIASALYVANYRFAIAQTNYLNATAAPSPFQHYWSLGVEEQFYVLWPLLLIGASLIWRRRGGPDRTTAIAGLGVVTVASFALSLWLTRANQPWAFFSLPTRAWELGVGGILALAAPSARRLAPAAAALLGWLGLLVTVGSLFVINANTAFPGTAALAPVLGAAAILAAGEVVTGTTGTTRAAHKAAVSHGPVRVLGTRPMRVVGRISYSWYLWHWPFIILAPYALGHTLRLWQDLLVTALSGVVAMASYLLVENPARTSRWLSEIPRRSLLAGGGLSAGGVAACLVVAATVPSITGHGIAPIAALHAGSASSRKPAATKKAVNPLQAQLELLTAEINAQVASSVGPSPVPANLTPSLANAHGDQPYVNVDGCLDSFLASNVENCEFGDTASSTSVVLFGDSHASMWFPAVDYAANKYGWRLYNWTKATCPPLLLPIYSPELGRTFTECEDWQQNVLARMRQLRPALVILGVARQYTSIYGFTPYQSPWLDAFSQMVTMLRGIGARVLVMGPVPKPPFIVPDCLSAHLDDSAACDTPLSVGINQAGMAAERAAVTSAGGNYFDVQPWFCAGGTCAAIVDNLEVWRDDNHITATYASFLGPALSAELALVMAEPAP
jgi:peptidoglycan/LPS O-acetylase OafA/YrhL